MKMNSFIVYKHTTPSEKVYIGITSMKPEKRWKNGKGYELCTAFNRAIQKYGWKNIRHEVLLSGLSKDEACAEEQRFIRLYDSTNPLKGYNLTSGGEHYEPNDEWRRRLSESNKQYYKNHPEARLRITERQKGMKHSESSNRKRSETMKQYFINHPEQREQRGASFRGKKRGIEFSNALSERKSKSVICNETGKVYKSIAKASEDIGVSRTAITNMLHGRAKTCQGYTFAFTEGKSDEGNQDV